MKLFIIPGIFIVIALPSYPHLAWGVSPNIPSEKSFLGPRINTGDGLSNEGNETEYSITLKNLEERIIKERLKESSPAKVRVKKQYKETEKGYKQSVVRIISGGRYGSGFYITDFLVATNAHVIGDSLSAMISFRGDRPFNAEVKYIDSVHDYALLLAEVPGKPMNFQLTPMNAGEEVVSLGFPQGRSVLAASTGTVIGSDACCIIHDSLIAGGSSGGPLLSSDGRVIGLNTYLSKTPGDMKNSSDRAIAVRIDYIIDD